MPTIQRANSAGGRVFGGSFFRPRNFGAALGAVLLVFLASAIGMVLRVLPGIAIGFFAMFTIPFAIDRSLSPVDAIKASFTTVKSNIGEALLTWLVVQAVSSAGQLVCGVGVLVSIPIGVLIQVYAYRRLTGGRVAALTP